ncbi:MAG TPA: efflux RND transporter permease subunit [Bryobacteraceae bacterium]|jgi:multidrug efflux pump subunit AcrB|nr:efflux RND transporter permease subunit [Bryobacteraceae bacterium]
MWIVKLALRRPYTFVVMAVLIAILGGLSLISMQKDIFPYIDIPVATVVWTYVGISPNDMANRIVTISERAMTTTVNDIEHMESSSYNGVAVIRVFFQPNVKIDLAIAQISALNQTILRVLPPGIFPPAVIKYDASSVPILQLGVGSKTLSEQELFDLGLNFVRTQLATVQGASIPLPYGGKQRQIMVDIDPEALYSRQLSATDVSNAINNQNLILPAGTAKIGARDYFIQLNSSPTTVAAMNNLPVKTNNGAITFMKDVAQVHDGFAVQTNIVRLNGRRSTLLTVLKNGQASTLDIVNQVKAALPNILAGMPPGLQIAPLFDQSIFVRAAMNGVVREAGIAAVLTALMILLFLGSWRSTLIVCTSIPLSILTSCIILWAMGHTLNVMTLGGMALAVGILVDDATVEIENVHRNMGFARTLTRAILDGAQQIALPSFVSTLAICIVFVPVLLLTGPAKFLFTPLALAVVFAMMMSYFLTRTLVPTMVHYMLESEVEIYSKGEEGLAHAKGFIWQTHHAFNIRFERMREKYQRALAWCLHHRARVSVVYGVFVLASLGLAAVVGSDFFPYIDSGQLRLHVRAPEGTRIEETERIFGEVEEDITRNLQKDELDQIVDNIGLPNSVNLAFGDSATIGSGDGDILISLDGQHHRPTLGIQRELRRILRRDFPDESFFFEAANMTNQILNFGIPAPIDIQIVGRNLEGNFKVAQELQRKIAGVPGAVDVHINQEVNTPAIDFNVDRSKADQAGLTQRDVANSMLISLSSSGQTAPNQWLNPANGINYNVAVQTPQNRIDSIDAIRRTPITGPSGGKTQLLDNLLSGVNRSVTTTLINHYNVQPVFDVLANTDQRDLGGVATDIRKIIDDEQKHLPRATTIAVRGQVDTMQTSFRRLGFGMIFAIVLVYLLMVVNFQSWLDPFIILTALPGAFAGILWMLYATQTTLNVPSMMGSIMAVGVATANSILLVTFANDERAAGKDQIEAALSAGVTRLRPVLMTALAMIIGMLPMALALGEGGEQNAPLGRAVIGGLILATFSTLFFVPIVYSFLRRKPPVDQDDRIEMEANA